MKNLKKWRNDFRISNHTERYYDIIEDYELIESSFAMQYGIRLRNEDAMTWSEFCSLLSGIMPDTPLGNVVQIRSEKNPEKLKSFTPHQREIRHKWINRHKRIISESDYSRQMEFFKGMFKSLAGGERKCCKA